MPRARKNALGALVALVVTAMALGVAVGVPQLFARETTVPPVPRSVIVITLDTLRTDALGKGDSPAIDRFLQTTRRYAGARTAVPLTLPAHASLFSGLMPNRTGIHDNVGPGIEPPADRDYPLLAEQFQDAGYATGAIVARAVLQPLTGISSGFGEYHCPNEQSPETDAGGYMHADYQVELASAWLHSHADRPFFLWVHFFDPHGPHMPYAGDDRRAGTKADDSPAARYAGEVRRLDAGLERLFDVIPDDAIVVIASDHGEGLYEHNERSHGPLCFSTTIDMVLALRAPGIEPGVDRAPRSICDVAPTLRLLCGLDQPVVDGTTLTGTAADIAVTESLYGWRRHGWAQTFAAFDGRYTLVDSGPVAELFDRKNDPGETKPLDLARHPAYERLDRALTHYRSSSSDDERDRETLPSVPPYGAERRPVSPYLSRAENAKLDDPRALMGWWDELIELDKKIQAAFLRRDVDALRQLVEQIRERAPRSPTSPVPHSSMATALRALGQLTRDRTAYGDSVRASMKTIELGFAVPRTLELALAAAMRARDPKLMRDLLALCVESGLVPDTSCAQRLHGVATSDTAHAKLALQLLNRARAHADAAGRKQIDVWAASLSG